MDGSIIDNDPDVSAGDLHLLSEHEDVDVRIAVGDHKNTAIPTVMQLARDEHADVRYALAENHQIDSRVLDILVNDENPFVADRAKKTLLRVRKTLID